MELHTRVLPPEILIPELLGLLEEADSVPLVISGGSMTPFLVHGRDTVYLSKVSKPLKRGDMILYRRTTGRYVLHRIYKVHRDGYSLVGDAQTQIEPGIRQEQVLAVVDAVHRNGKLLKSGNFCWLFFEKVWIRMVPFRRLIIGLYGTLKENRRRAE